VLAPAADKVLLDPAHMVTGDAVNVIVGTGLTRMLIVPGATATHPTELVPVTE